MIDEQMLGVNKEENENMGYVVGVIVRGVRCGLGGEVGQLGGVRGWRDVERWIVVHYLFVF